MSTEENNPSKPFVYSSPTKSNIQKTSSSFGVITNVPVSTGYMVFMTNVCSLSFFCRRRAFDSHRWATCVPRLIDHTVCLGKRRYNIKLWKTFTDCFNCLPIAAIIDEKIFTMHGGLSPDLQSMEQIRRVMRPTDVPDTGEFFVLTNPMMAIDDPIRHSRVFFFFSFLEIGLLCDLLWSDPDKDITGWSENDRGVSFTFGPDVVSRFLQKHDMDLICRAHQVSREFFFLCGVDFAMSMFLGFHMILITGCVC